ncbi:tetratricopeptide repeat protein 21A [Crotalus adamanteus]|uniref:Tetratricopeptide repeat protein 21A n=1 Tax=Crotalus adamanteus TaxID=8729 RepID=A0AAW1B2B4_CROAD
MGKAKYFMVHQNYSGALEIISQLVVTFPFFVPALVTKMKLHLAMQDWEQSVEESKRILSKEPNDIDGLQYMVVNHLAVTGNKSMALRLLREFIVALDMKEPQRPEFHFQKMLVITRLVLAYLQAVIASRKNKTEQIAGAFLNEAAELHFSALHGLPLSIEYYEKLNPMFLIEIVKEYLVFCPKQIHLSQRNIKECAHSLEIGVSYNFQLRDSPLYHFIKAKALNKAGEYPEAIKVLKMLINIPQMKGDAKKGQGPFVTMSEQVSIYLELAEALRLNGELPEKALEVYEAAQKKNPLDATVARKIGQAYVYTHQYNKAINYYEVALKMSEQDFLCHDLADLLLKLKKFGKAEKVLSQALDHDPVDDLPSMMKDVKNLILLAKIYETIKREIFLETLTKAYDIQQRILKRVGVEQPELIPPQKQMLLKICVQFAKFHQSEKEYEKAVKYYSEALACVPTDNKIIFELAELYLILGDTDQYNFSVMESLIDLLRRSGKLDEATPFFELAKKKSIRTPLEPGYNYCMGLYCWHLWQPNQALKFFNKARKDSDWGQKALSYMILICLNPDNEIVGGETFENQNTTDASNLKEKKESEQHGIRTAEKLLKEFYPHSQEGQNQVEMLQSYCLMATKEKYNVEKALKVFIEMGQNERDNVPAILAMAQAYMLLKHTAKARTQLKRLIKVSWSLPDADELEKAWLLLSDIYCTSGKYDLATEHVKRCLRYNKSCAKAYECLGFIAEKENAYKDATLNYELAWKYSNQANPAVGFKLAFNYLKDKKYVEAIDVCHDVLKAYPDYPKIKEEILEKAQMSFKP